MSKHENFIKENQDWLARVGYWLLIGSMILVSVLGAFWLLWMFYTGVVPQIFPHGPENLINPNYWLFVGFWFLIWIVGRIVSIKSKAK